MLRFSRRTAGMIARLPLRRFKSSITYVYLDYMRMDEEFRTTAVPVGKNILEVQSSVSEQFRSWSIDPTQLDVYNSKDDEQMLPVDAKVPIVVEDNPLHVAVRLTNQQQPDLEQEQAALEPAEKLSKTILKAKPKTLPVPDHISEKYGDPGIIQVLEDIPSLNVDRTPLPLVIRELVDGVW